MKFGQLTDYNMRKHFSWKIIHKRGGEATLKPFSEKLKLSLSLDQYSKVLYILLLLYAKLRAIKYIETKPLPHIRLF